MRRKALVVPAAALSAMVVVLGLLVAAPLTSGADPVDGSGAAGQAITPAREVAPLVIPEDGDEPVQQVTPSLAAGQGGVPIGMTDEGIAARERAERGEATPTTKQPARLVVP
jgi:hypothetical protein